MSSRIPVKHARTRGSRPATAPGENRGPSRCRHLVCSGGSSISGIHRYDGFGTITDTERFENVDGSWSAPRMCSRRVMSQNSFSSAVPKCIGACSRSSSYRSKCAHGRVTARLMSSYRMVGSMVVSSCLGSVPMFTTLPSARRCPIGADRQSPHVGKSHARLAHAHRSCLEVALVDAEVDHDRGGPTIDDDLGHGGSHDGRRAGEHHPDELDVDLAIPEPHVAEQVPHGLRCKRPEVWCGDQEPGKADRPRHLLVVVVVLLGRRRALPECLARRARLDSAQLDHSLAPSASSTGVTTVTSPTQRSAPAVSRTVISVVRYSRPLRTRRSVTVMTSETTSPTCICWWLCQWRLAVSTFVPPLGGTLRSSNENSSGASAAAGTSSRPASDASARHAPSSSTV